MLADTLPGVAEKQEPRWEGLVSRCEVILSSVALCPETQSGFQRCCAGIFPYR